MRVLLFHPRFELPLLAGTKTQTIRREPVRPITPGEVLSLRRWSGRPYCGPQHEIVPLVRCTDVRFVRIEAGWGVLDSARLEVAIDGVWLERDEELDAFARRDGFACAAELLTYYRERGTRQFTGVVIEWRRMPLEEIEEVESRTGRRVGA